MYSITQEVTAARGCSAGIHGGSLRHEALTFIILLVQSANNDCFPFLLCVCVCVCVCVHLSAFISPSEHRRRSNQALQQRPLQFLYPLRGRGIVRLFLCDVRRFSVPQPHALRETSLQCSFDHSVVCREVLLLFHLLSLSH